MQTKKIHTRPTYEKQRKTHILVTSKAFKHKRITK